MFCGIALSVGGLCAAFVAAFPFVAFELREKLKEPLPSLLCRAGEPCNITPASFRMLEEEVSMHAVFSPFLSGKDIDAIHELFSRRFVSRRGHGGAPFVLHIGPADLEPEELALYKHILPKMDAEKERVVFVEPHPGQQVRLREKIRDNLEPLGRARIEVLPAAVCGSAADNVVFYRISDKFYERFRGDHWYFTRYWSSLEKRNLIKELQFYNLNGKAWLFKAIGVFPQAFPASDEDWNEYIEEVPVRCHTPSTLLKALDIDASAIDVLLMDTEGYDTQLMNLFVDMKGFNPVTIQFEWHLHDNEPARLAALVELVLALHTRGYDIHRHNHDVVAMRQIDDAAFAR